MTISKFALKTGEITIDDDKCKHCQGCACVKACSLFGKNLFRIENNKPVVISNPEIFERACIECLACELMCKDYGNNGLTIELNMFGLDEYRRKKK